MTIATAKEIHDGLIIKRLHDHYEEALEYFSEDQVVGIFLQGSQNYGLDTEHSDVVNVLVFRGA